MFATPLPHRFASFRRISHHALLAAAGASLAVLTGCAGFANTATSDAVTGLRLKGNVHGGQQPVSGAHLYLYTVGTSGYGSASTSIITPGAPGTGSDGTNSYVVSDANGNFTLTQYTCAVGTEKVYLLAVGGNPGLVGNNISNTAITLISSLGPCSGLTAATNVVVNEVTTAASITALQQFMVDPTHIGTSSGNTAGLDVATALVTDIVDAATGSARSTNVKGTGTLAGDKLNTLGNILAPCINSGGPGSTTSADCDSLFTAVKPAGGTAPTTVAAAMLLIAQNPGNNVANIYKLSNAVAPFQPHLSTQPNDFTVAITYKGGGLTAPGDVVIDAAGQAWVSNCPSCTGTGTDSIVAFGTDGSLLTGSTGYTNGIHKPQGLAFDSAGNLWSTNLAVSGTAAQVVKMTGNSVDFAYASSTLTNPLGIAIDSSDKAFVVNQAGPGSVLLINSDGTTNAASPFTDANLYFPTGIAIDSAGSSYVASTGTGALLQFNNAGAAQPVGGITGYGLTQPVGVSLDHTNNSFTINNDSSKLSVVPANGTTTNGSPYAVGISNAVQIAVDGFGTLWIPNCASVCTTAGSAILLHVTSGGVTIPQSNFYLDPNLLGVQTSAIDGTGNLWVTNNAGGSVTEFLGVAGPVKTPVAVQASSNQIGIRP